MCFAQDAANNLTLYFLSSSWGYVYGWFEEIIEALSLIDRTTQRWSGRRCQDHEWFGRYEARTPLQDVTQCAKQGPSFQALQEAPEQATEL